MRSALVILLGFLMTCALAAQVPFPDLRVEGNLVFPQIAVGGGLQAMVILMNLGTAAATGNLRFFGQDGAAMQVNHELRLVTEIEVEVAAGGVQYLPLTSLSKDAKVGWVLFEMSGSHPLVYGSIVYTFYLPNESIGYQLGVSGSRYQLLQFRKIVAPVLISSSTNTGIAVVNTSTQEMTITLTLVDMAGKEKASATLVLAPGNQRAKFVTELFTGTDLTSFQGMLKLETDKEGMVALALLLSQGVLATVPVIPLPAG